MASVDRGQEAQTAPADVVASAVMLNVHRCKVASFPEEELEAVAKLETHVDNHRVADVAKALVLRVGIGDCADGPEDHSKTTVCELFNIPAKDAWVELCAPIVVK